MATLSTSEPDRAGEDMTATLPPCPCCRSAMEWTGTHVTILNGTTHAVATYRCDTCKTEVQVPDDDQRV